MPLYEYQCGNCGERHERLERLSAPRVHACPRCGGDMHRLLGVPALQFKGSGWYVTDYGRGSGGAAAPAKTEPSAARDTSAKKDTSGKSGSGAGAA